MMNSNYDIPEAVSQAVVGLIAPYCGIKTVADLKLTLSGKAEVDRFLIQSEAEFFTRLSYWSLRRAEQAGRLTVIHAGRKRLYRQTDLENFLTNKIT